MGTLREGSICSTDYTSSSEQSCDTVIYMGDNGYPVSDRDLTDCEGPPRGGTAIPRPRFTPPSGLVKTSSLTKVEEVIEGRHHSTQPYSMPSAYGSLTHQSKGGGGGVGGKSRLHKGFVRGFTEQELVDNDLGKEARSGSGRSIGGERWIDGPGSMYPGSRDSEQWVDGPPEFRMDTRPEESSLVRSPAKVAEANHSSTGTKLFASGGGVSRIPHKAARTAKIAMLFKRETSPTEEENSRVKHHSGGQTESQVSQDAEPIVSHEEESGCQGFLVPTDDPCVSSSNPEQSDCSIRTGAGDSSMPITEDGGNTYGDISLRSVGDTSEETKAEQDELCCDDEDVVLDNQVTETNIDEVMSHAEQQHYDLGEKKGGSEEEEEEKNLVVGCLECLTSDGIDNLNCETSFLPSYEPLLEENVKASQVSDEFDRVASSQRLGTSATVDEGPEATQETDRSGADVAQPRRSSALKLDIESLLLQNRESIYELQMDEELEHGSRESLQRLMYGSDDDSSVWNSEEPAHSVDIVDESNPFLDALSLATFNDLLGQSGNHLLHLSNHQNDNTFVPQESEQRTSDADGQQLLDADLQVILSAATEAVVSDDVAGDAVNVSNDEEKSVEIITKSPTNNSLCSTSDDCAPQKSSLVKSSATNNCLDPTTSMTSGLVPRAASTPIKPSSLRLPTGRTASSKLPEATKCESSKKPPPTPRTSSLATVKKNQVTNNEATNAVSEQTSPSTQSGKTPSKISSLAKDSSTKSGDEKESTGIRRLTTFGFKTNQSSLAKPSVPKTTSNNSVTNKKKLTAINVATPKIPVPVSPAMSTKSAKQSRIALPTSTKKSKPKASSDICARVETTSAVIEKDGRLMSPYHLVTKPRISVHSSSGHGSDGSSVVENRKSTSKRSEVEVSSGYESMIRDSEVTGTSSSQDSNSECASSGKGRGIKIFRKKGRFQLALIFLLRYYCKVFLKVFLYQ